MEYNPYYDEDPLKGAQQVMFDMMKVVHEICEANDIAYWLCDGTLLGAIRHKGFIPWDDDSDIGFLRKDYDKFLKVAEKSLPPQFKLETKEKYIDVKHNWSKMCYYDEFEWIDEQNVTRRGLSIDLFPYDYVKNSGTFTPIEKFVHRFARIEYPSETNTPKEKLGRFINNVGIHNYYKKFNKETDYLTYGIETTFYGFSFLEKRDLFPLKKADFWGFSFSVPNDSDAYLTKTYGDYMVLPKDSEKRIHMLDIQYIHKDKFKK